MKLPIPKDACQKLTLMSVNSRQDVNKLVSATPQTKNTMRKLRSSALKWYQGLGVLDRVFVVKY